MSRICSTIFLSAIFTSQARVIVISVDGLRPDAVTTLGPELVPNFYRLRTEGAFTDNARTDVNYTTTLPNHTGMITSRPVLGPCGHGLTVNSGTNDLHVVEYKAGMFDVAHDHGLSTALFANKSKFRTFNVSYDEMNGAPDLTGEDQGRDKIDVFQVAFSDSTSVTSFVEAMTLNLWDLSMLHIRLPDSAGHGSDWNLNLESPYMASIKTVDGFLGQVFEMIDNTSDLTETTHLIVTTDHGGTRGTFTHTNPLLPTNYTIPFYVWGPGVEAGGDLYELNPDLTDPGTVQPSLTSPTPPLRNSAVGNLALDFLDLPPIPGSCVNVSQQLRVTASPDFLTVYPDLDPDEDANGNGLNNFFDYALGADPRGRHRVDLMPRWEGDRLVVCLRANTADVELGAEISADLKKWAPLLKGATFIPMASEEIPTGRRISLLVPTLARRSFYRQVLEQ